MLLRVQTQTVVIIARAWELSPCFYIHVILLSSSASVWVSISGSVSHSIKPPLGAYTSAFVGNCACKNAMYSSLFSLRALLTLFIRVALYPLPMLHASTSYIGWLTAQGSLLMLTNTLIGTSAVTRRPIPGPLQDTSNLVIRWCGVWYFWALSK